MPRPKRSYLSVHAPSDKILNNDNVRSQGNFFGILLNMSQSSQFSFLLVGDAIDAGAHHISAQSGVKNALLQGGIWNPTKGDQVDGLSMIISVSRESAHIVVVRGGDFIAEAAIVCRNPDAAVDTFRELLGHDADDEWFETLERRNQVVSALNALLPPFCLIMWKTQASDRLSEVEAGILTAELLRVVSGVTFELLENIRDEGSGL